MSCSTTNNSSTSYANVPIGTRIQVEFGNNKKSLHTATIINKPYKLKNKKQWVVEIQYDWDKSIETVPCTSCIGLVCENKTKINNNKNIEQRRLPVKRQIGTLKYTDIEDTRETRTRKSPRKSDATAAASAATVEFVSPSSKTSVVAAAAIEKEFNNKKKNAITKIINIDDDDDDDAPAAAAAADDDDSDYISSDDDECNNNNNNSYANVPIGTPIQVESGKNKQHLISATTVNIPYYSSKEQKWVVNVQYDWDKSTEIIPCSSCFGLKDFYTTTSTTTTSTTTTFNTPTRNITTSKMKKKEVSQIMKPTAKKPRQQQQQQPAKIGSTDENKFISEIAAAAAAFVSPLSKTKECNNNILETIDANENKNNADINNDNSVDESDNNDKKPAAISDDANSSSGGGSNNNEYSEDNNKVTYNNALTSLLITPNVNETEAKSALDKVGPPYGLQTVMSMIHKERERVKIQRQLSSFQPYIGMKIRKMFHGKECTGTVVEKCDELVEVLHDDGTLIGEQVWNVKYDIEEKEDDDDDDDDASYASNEDMNYDELFQYRANRPTSISSCLGRKLQSLELFCGNAIISQYFKEHKWDIASIDISPVSNATIRRDILTIDNPDMVLPFVPDFIWASPPCHTYSNAAGNKHRTKDELDKSIEARKHNHIFQKMVQFLHWAKQKHPHLIIVIENPVGRLQNMPLMKELEKSFNLHSTVINYCAYGRDEMKPTTLWSNDYDLCYRLSHYTCKNKCKYYGRGKNHPGNIQRDGNELDFASIPEPLAEDIAHYIDSKFTLQRIQWYPAATTTTTTTFGK